MKRFQNILVPTDFGAPAAAALELAVALAGTFDSDVTLLHAWQLPAYPYMEVVFRSNDLLELAQQAAEARLGEELTRLHSQLPRAKSELRMGIAWQEIIDRSKTLGCDLIVMGTQGRHGLGHALLGSVAEKVVRFSAIPVLTVHTPSVA